MTQNSSFSCFMAVFMSYCPQLWGSTVIYIFLVVWPKTRRFCVLWLFSWSIAHSFWLLGQFWDLWPKTRRFCVLWSFSWVISRSFWVPGWFTMTIIHKKCLRAWQRSRPFRVLCPFSRAIAHIFGVTRGFPWPVRPDTCLRVMSKNSSFSRLIVVFMNYCPRVWRSRAIYDDLNTWYMFEGMTKNSSFSCFMTVFRSYTPQFLRSREIYLFESYDQKLVIFTFMAIFMIYCPTFGVPGWFTTNVRTW